LLTPGGQPSALGPIRRCSEYIDRMHRCPRCGTPQLPTQPSCRACGLAFGPEARPAAPPPAGANAARPLAQTMLGYAPPTAPLPPQANPRQQTMLGMAPVRAPTVEPDRAEPAVVRPERPPAQSAPALPSQLKTMLGVARPGIAPVNPGVAKPGPRFGPEQSFLAPASPNAEPSLDQPGPRVSEHGSRTRVAWIGVGVLGAALLLGALALLAILTRRATPLTALVRIDEQGVERVELSCPNCEDGTTLRLGSASATFSKQRALLPLDRPLRVGNNELSLSLKRPDSRSPRDVTVTVPLQYRVRGDFAGLAQPKPMLRVLVEALPESSVVIDGQAVAIAANGKGIHLIDVSSELTGPAAKTVALERVVPYTIAAPGGSGQRGEIRLKLGIVPLLVDAPGDSIVIDVPNFMLAGNTQPTGTVTVAGRPITVDATGRFAQLMNVSSVGETTIDVRAAAPDQAPRSCPLRIKRVASLKTEAVAFAARATDSYAAIATDSAAKKGWAVALFGEVVEARTQNHTSVVLLDVKKGCTSRPCLARLVHGAKVDLVQGDHARAYGHVLGAVDGPRTGHMIPEVRAQFFLGGDRE